MRAFSKLAVVAVAGCWTGSTASQQTTPIEPAPQARSAGLECAQVVAHALEVSKEELSRTAKPDQFERIRVAAIDSCLTMKWSQELLACFNAAKTGDELGTCQTKMTEAQNADLQKRLIEVQSDPPQDPCGNPCAP